MENDKLRSVAPAAILVGITLVAGITRFWQIGIYPPGLWFDEAWIGLAARDGGNEPYYAASFGGMHPAVIYLTRGFQLLFDDALAGRYALAFVGTLSIPLGFLAYRATARRYLPFSKRLSADQLGLIAAWSLAFLFPFFHFSRIGFESMLPLPVVLIVLWGFALPFSIGRTLFLGVVLGLSIYTFDSGRFIPIAFSFVYWGEWLISPKNERPTLLKLLTHYAAIVVIALVVAAPILLYFYENQDQLWTRAISVTQGTLGSEERPVWLILLQNLGKTIAGISIPGFGDQLARHNLPGRPMLDPLASILFWSGALALVWKRAYPALILCLSWFLIGSTPVFITEGAPTYTRMFVAYPVFPILVAAGAAAIVDLMPPKTMRWGTGMVVLLLVASAGVTLFDYFERYSTRSDVYAAFGTGRVDAARFAQARSEEVDTYFIPQNPYRFRPVYDLIPPSDRRLPSAPCLIVPPHDHPAEILIDPRLDPNSADAYSALYPDLSWMTPVRDPFDGAGLLRQMVIPAGTSARLPGEPLENRADFGGEIQLNRIDWGDSELRFVWEAAGEISTPRTLFLHVYAAGGEDQAPLFQIDRQPCYQPTRLWRPGEQIIDPVSFDLPEGIHLDETTIAIGWYDAATFERLPLVVVDAADDRILPGDRLIIR